ncbi:hypothetical protein ACIQCF_33785 [Streptomyces sp. NPDC088353]|uniref:hypothetical protein n=1 Tax=Streptomyces sp. NPDC088353 TaxID=3365855 RepID=UPI003815F7CA
MPIDDIVKTGLALLFTAWGIHRVRLSNASTVVVAVQGGRQGEGSSDLSVETVYDEERAALKTIIRGGPALKGEAARLHGQRPGGLGHAVQVTVGGRDRFLDSAAYTD